MATRLVNISSTTSGSAPAAWGTVPDLTVSSITVESTSSVLLLVATVALGEATDATADFRFLVNGVATGSPNVHAFSDNAANGEAGGATLMWAIDGLSGSSNTFAVQWQDRTGTPIIEVSDPHTFQVIEFAAGASIIVDQSGNSLGTSPSSIGSLLSQSAVTTAAGAIHLFIGNIPVDPNGTDSTQRMQFGIDGTPEGPSSFFSTDTTLEGSGGEISYLKTGLSAASHSFELNWVIASGSGQPQSTSSVFGNANFQVIEITAPNTVHTNISSAASWATTTTYANDPNLASTETIGDSTAVVLVGATAAQAATGTDSCIDFSIGIDSANVGGIGRCYADSTAMYEGTCVIHAATGLSGSHTFQLRAKELITGDINTSVDRQLWVVELPNEGITSVTPSNFDMDTASVTAAGQGFAATIGSSDVYLSPNDLLSEAGEVDVTAAVNTWADGSVNLDFTQLSAATLTLLHTMGPGDRYLIINVGGVPGTDEFSYPIFLNRPVAMELRASANIAAGGEATTDQGTPPATKTGTDFFTGRRWDDENGTDSLTFGADEYTWVEWCYGATAKAREVKYKYRVTVQGELLDTYTVVAKATIAAGDSAALTTVSGASAVGNLALGARAFLLAGMVATSSVGAVGNSVTVGLTGVSSTSNVGSVGVTKSGSLALTGIESAGAVGSVGFTESGNVGITGIEITSSVGDFGLSVGGSDALTGIESTSAVGSVNNQSGLTLSGTEATGEAGSVDHHLSLNITGVEGASAIGGVTASAAGATSITGVESTSNVGSVGLTKSGSVELTGTEGTASVGTITASAGATVPITGVESTSAVGSVGFAESGQVALSGIEATASVGDVVYPGAGPIALSGVEATAAVGTLTPPGVTYGGTYNAVEAFPASSSVTIALYDPITGDAVALDDNVCPEITAGIYVWDSSKLTTQPSGYQEYVWSMTDSVTVKGGIINMFDATDSVKLGQILDRVTDVWQFDGNDSANPVTLTGDGKTTSTAAVDGKTKTALPDSITRT